MSPRGRYQSIAELETNVCRPTHRLTPSTNPLFSPSSPRSTSAIISGAVVGKMRWSWFMAFTAMWHIFVYCPLAHWFFYYKGWMYTYGVVSGPACI